MTLDATTLDDTENLPAEVASNQEVVTLRQQSSDALTVAELIVIDSPEMYELAADNMRDAKTIVDKLEDERTKITKPINESLRNTNDLFKRMKSKPEQVVEIYKNKMLDYSRAEDARRAELQQKADAQAAQERAQLEAAEKQAEQELHAAIDTGNAEAAEIAIVQADQAREARELAEVAPVRTSTVAVLKPKASGTSRRKNWKARITNLDELILAAADDIKAGRNFANGFLQANEQALNNAAKALEAKLTVPGVEPYNDETITAKRK